MTKKFPPYGGIPASGGFKPYTEYEVGAMRVVEAIHCILGSCAKIINRYNDGVTFYNALRVERNHLAEEYNIIDSSSTEYRKEMYTGMLFHPMSKYDEKTRLDSQKSLIDTAVILVETSRKMREQVMGDFPDMLIAVYFVVLKCYRLIEVFCEAIQYCNNIQENAFKDKEYILAVIQLRNALVALYDMNPNEVKN